MTIGNELDETFYKLGQRLTALENNQEMFSFRDDTKDLRREVGDLNAEAATFATYAQLKKIETELTEQIVRVAAQSDVEESIERVEAELNDRIDEVENDMGFDPDDLRCDLESQIEDLRDSISYNDDRIDEIEAYKVTESEVEDIMDRMIDDRISETVTNAVCDEVNERAVGWTEFLTLRDRVKELEDRLNKPSITARVMRWLREGPSIKETATSWYAGIRRGS